MRRIPQKTPDIRQREQRAYQYIEELLDAADCPRNEWARYSQYPVDPECFQMHFKRRLNGAYNVLEILINTGPRMFLNVPGGILINGIAHSFDSAVAEIRGRYADYHAALGEDVQP
jgi:hypothetical protein